MRFIPKRLSDGHYIIINELGEAVKNKKDFSLMVFEFRDTAKLTAIQFKFAGLPKELTF